jgi:hypothetical protein
LKQTKKTTPKHEDENRPVFVDRENKNINEELKCNGYLYMQTTNRKKTKKNMKRNRQVFKDKKREPLSHLIYLEENKTKTEKKRKRNQ